MKVVVIKKDPIKIVTLENIVRIEIIQVSGEPTYRISDGTSTYDYGVGSYDVRII